MVYRITCLFFWVPGIRIYICIYVYSIPVFCLFISRFFVSLTPGFCLLSLSVFLPVCFRNEYTFSGLHIFVRLIHANIRKYMFRLKADAGEFQSQRFPSEKWTSRMVEQRTWGNVSNLIRWWFLLVSHKRYLTACYGQRWLREVRIRLLRRHFTSWKLITKKQRSKKRRKRSRRGMKRCKFRLKYLLFKVRVRLLITHLRLNRIVIYHSLIIPCQVCPRVQITLPSFYVQPLRVILRVPTTMIGWVPLVRVCTRQLQTITTGMTTVKKQLRACGANLYDSCLDVVPHALKAVERFERYSRALCEICKPFSRFGNIVLAQVYSMEINIDYARLAKWKQEFNVPDALVGNNTQKTLHSVKKWCDQSEVRKKHLLDYLKDQM
jgi:hypothetical protein